MYPIIRQIKEFVVHRNAPDLDPLGTHVSYHRCWPQDIDIYMEMNNGRGENCAVQALYRSAVTDKNGIVAPKRVRDHIGLPTGSPPLPAWVDNWIDADATRPWPPAENGLT